MYINLAVLCCHYKQNDSGRVMKEERNAPIRITRSQGGSRGWSGDGHHASMPAILRALFDQLDHPQRGNARRGVSSFRRHVHGRRAPGRAGAFGGEAMLRPGLVFDLATRARAVGCRVTALSGLFFATSHRIPGDIYRAIVALDHFSVSIDAFHEREVPGIASLQSWRRCSPTVSTSASTRSMRPGTASMSTAWSAI